MEPHGHSMDTPWNFHGVPWNFHGLPWNSMEVFHTGKVVVVNFVMLVCFDLYVVCTIQYYVYTICKKKINK